MADVDNSLHYVASIGEAATNTLPSLTGKQELLARLLEHEHSRLQVWLFPLSHEQRHIFRANRGPERVSLSVRTECHWYKTLET